MFGLLNNTKHAFVSVYALNECEPVFFQERISLVLSLEACLVVMEGGGI